MGTWNTKIDGNDTFRDIYQDFFDLYNKGQDSIEVSKQIQLDSADMFEDYDDRHNSLFALALAQWETKCLDVKLFEEVKNIIETDKNIEQWIGFGTSSQTVQKRKKELAAFLAKISVERSKAKRRSKKKSIFEAKRLVSVIAPDNLKEFYVSEEYIDNKYIHTSGLLMWGTGGGSVLYFEGEGKYISAIWLNSTTLKIIHAKEIVFSMKKESGYYCGDEVKILYKTQ